VSSYPPTLLLGFLVMKRIPVPVLAVGVVGSAGRMADSEVETDLRKRGIECRGRTLAEDGLEGTERLG